jgi:hypothetical protein
MGAGGEEFPKTIRVYSLQTGQEAALQPVEDPIVPTEEMVVYSLSTVDATDESVRRNEARTGRTP